VLLPSWTNTTLLQGARAAAQVCHAHPRCTHARTRRNATAGKTQPLLLVLLPLPMLSATQAAVLLAVAMGLPEAATPAGCTTRQPTQCTARDCRRCCC
jgi:hypothetical protein